METLSAYFHKKLDIQTIYSILTNIDKNAIEC